MLRDMNTATKIGLGFALPLLLFVALAGFALSNITGLLENTSKVGQSQEAVGYGERLVTSMADQEAGERAFLLTGSEQFLSGYKGAQKSFAEALEGARKAVEGNAEQLDRLQKIEALAERFVKEAAEKEIDKRRQMNRGDATMEDVSWAVKTSTGRPILLELRKTARAFVDAEREGLAARSASAAKRAGLATWGTRIVTLVALALAIAAVVVLARNVSGTVKTLAREARGLTEAVAAGRLSERAHPEVVGSEFRPVLTGMNEIMDAYARPVAMTSEYVRRIATGESPPPVTEEFQGDFNVIKESLNELISMVHRRGEDIDKLIAAALEGRLDYRADASRYEGGNARVIDGMNRMLDALTQPLKMAASYVDRIARGDIPEKITAEYRGDFGVIKQNLNTCVDAIHRLISDARFLADAAVQGKLGTRADPARHQGDFRKIVEGVNATLDAVIGPLQVAARYVEQISRGEIPPRIEAAYAGDFGQLRDNLNTCIEAVNQLVRDANRLVDDAVAGRLSTRVDASAHQGDFRKVVDGVNRTLDAVLAPVTEASRVLEQLAARDLRVRATGEFAGDHARLKTALNDTAAALHDAMAQVASTVEQVSSAASQIASSSHAVADNASVQAGSLADTTSSIESVAGMVKQAADHAQRANQLALSARSAAGEGTAAVDQLQGTMVKIKQSAEGTSQIIRDVSDIAFQTNLLALNAAVEAARAGEAGRGFAVVAEEVRSLALRAKEAANKTEELIRQSVKQAGEGEIAAKQVAGKLGEITKGIVSVGDIVSEIAASAKDQTGGITQVTRAIGDMDRTTQQNAASAEESSSAAAELSGQAEELAAMIGSFRMDRADLQLTRRASAPPAPAARALPAAPQPRPAPQPAVAEVDALFPMDDEAEIRDF